jgi:octaprenyl-diphosphate synthase
VLFRSIDDIINGDSNALRNITLKDAHEFASKAIDALSNLENSAYKENLINLVNYLLDFSNTKIKNA